LKILLVDNDRVLMTFLSDILKESGHEIVGATDGVEAFEILKKDRFDVLFIDYVMPNMDGKTLCGFVRKMPNLSKSYIVLMSAIAAEEWEDFRTIGADVCLSKGPLNELKKNVFWILQNMKEAASICAEGEIIGLKNVYPRNITKELLVSKQHFQLILNKMSQGVLELNEKGQIVLANPAMLSLLKLKDIEVIGCHFLDIFSEYEKHRVKKIWEQDTGKPKKIDSDNPLKIGESMATLEIMPIKNNEQETSILAIFTDITRLKKAEEELKNMNKFLNQILNSSFSISILSTDLQQNISYWNKGAENLLGYKADEVLGKSIDILYPSPEEKQQASQLREQISRDKKEISTEIREVTKEGKEKWIKANLSAILDDNGNVIGIQGMGEDITERKIFEKALTESEMKFRAIFECAKDAIFIKDDNLRFTLVNPAMAAMVKIPAEHFIGKTEHEVFQSSSTFGTKSNEQKVLSGKIIEEDVVFSKRPEVINLHIIKVPLRNDNNEISGICGVARDVTERKLAKKERTRLEHRLHRAEKMESLGLMAGGVAHDLNNILSGIVSYPELILMDLPEDSPFRKPLKTIQESGMRAADVVEDLLTIARGVATGKETLNLNTTVREYMGSPEYQELEKMNPFVEIKTQLDPDLLNMSGSSTHIKKTLMNLVTNAFEAIVDNGTVTISTANRYLDEPLRGYEDVCIGEYAVLSVADDGSGISPEDLERIFEPFYTKKIMGRSGTGLGLAVVWNTVQDHNGYINAKTNEQGTTFELYFPVTRDDESSRQEAVALEDYVGHGERVLVVDDEENQRDIACSMLTKLGYKAEAVSSGEEAIEYVKKHPVDLIVLDMVMSKGLNGRETYEEIIKIHPGQKAIIASGYAKTNDVDLAQELGAGKYIKKPYILEKIGIAVKKEFEKKRLV